MEIVSHFSQLIYQEKIPNNLADTLKNLINTQKDTLLSLPPKLQALILSTHSTNINLYEKSETFRSIYTQCMPQYKLDIESIKLLQYALLSVVNAAELKHLKAHILRLNAAELITNQHARSLANFCTQSAFQAQQVKEEHKILNLKTLSIELSQILKRLHELKLHDKYYNTLNTIYTNAQNHKFSIGITGVLSAGKSTFLNALLGKEILGSSTIPETANLTILKYKDTESAEVFFWNTNEWEELKKAGQYDKSLQSFVVESERIFGDRLKSYIADTTKSESITLDKLSTYTSANHESKLCNLVKEVALFTPLKFLQNGVEIVDTPGLDDPITKREEITKDYITQCDLLIHVMNASCVATQIDIDFILESLLGQNISRLLIVLTRIDLIGEKELAQSLEYTKTSLATQLKKAEYSGDIDSIIERIDFIPVASFLALLHKTNREEEALNQGFSLEKTGILAVEEYLDKMLLGENSMKQKDILYLAYRGFLKTIEQCREEMRIESSLLNASENELEEMIANLKKEQNKLSLQLDSKKQELNAKQDEMQEFLSVLQNSMQKSLKREQERLQTRIFDEAVYGYTHGTQVDSKRIEEILESGLSDCFSDVSRDFKYKLAKKITQILLDENSDIKQPKVSFHAPKEQISKSVATLKDSIPKAISSCGKGRENELSIKLQEIFNESFKLFTQILMEKNKEVETKFLEYFSQILQAQEEILKTQITEKDSLLQDTLEKRKQNYTQEMRDAMQTKQTELTHIAEELAYITQALK